MADTARVFAVTVDHHWSQLKMQYLLKDQIALGEK